MIARPGFASAIVFRGQEGLFSLREQLPAMGSLARLSLARPFHAIAHSHISEKRRKVRGLSPWSCVINYKTKFDELYTVILKMPLSISPLDDNR